MTSVCPKPGQTLVLFLLMSKKAKIAILGDFPIGNICDEYQARTSFYPTWLFMLYKAFIRSDEFDIHWIIVDTNCKKSTQLTVENQTFHVLPGSKLMVGLYTGYLYNRWQISRCVKRIKPDIFHAWGTERFYGLAAKDFKGKSILSVQGLLSVCCKRAKMSPFENKHRLYEKGVLRSVDFITTESPWARDRVLEIAPKANITLCEYAIEPAFFSLERQLSDEPSCLISCSNAPIKNIPLAISAFSEPALSHVKLYMAGASPERYPDLPPNIIPLGRLCRESLIEHLSKCWCVVHPSLADTGPTAVKEARAAGVPVILTTECGAKQYVKHGESGYIIASNNKQELIEAVLAVTKSKENAQKMGAIEVERCRAALSCDNMYASFRELYNNVLLS
ncbi:MAG: glycosyltransferase family 4 protein [Akkermansiaceae bacterium]|nr:glycosyltransferase family 4 protein [Akkermansiaceae bacterium]